MVIGGYTMHRMKGRISPLNPPNTSSVFLVSTNDREKGIEKLLQKINLATYKDAKVALKANYNSDDLFPASTHSDTIRAIINGLKGAGAAEITLAERSGVGDTRRVLENLGVVRLAEELGSKVVALDDLGPENWSGVDSEGTHWLNGFKISKIFVESDRVVQTCCLKTHRFGGHFTMSLKNSVGLIAKSVPGEHYDYMTELHSSPYQRLMIAEINRFYSVDLVIMDAIEGFVKGGPESGELVKPNLLLASSDRVAIDAVGVALLRSYGTTQEVMKGSIFDQEQISRAAELGVGVRSPTNIRLVPLDAKSVKVAQELQEMLFE